MTGDAEIRILYAEGGLGGVRKTLPKVIVLVQFPLPQAKPVLALQSKLLLIHFGRVEDAPHRTAPLRASFPGLPLFSVTSGHLPRRLRCRLRPFYRKQPQPDRFIYL